MASTQTLEIPAPDGASPARAPDGSAAAGRDETAAAAGRQLLLFDAGGRLYGCDIGAVREIIPFRRCTRLPGSPSYVCGLTNLRGTVVTVMDLAARLGGAGNPGAMPNDAAARPGRPDGVRDARRDGGSIIVAEYGTKVVGLAVDGVRDVQALADEALDTSAATGGASAAPAHGAVVRGLGQLGDEVVIVLDVQTILRQVLA